MQNIRTLSLMLLAGLTAALAGLAQDAPVPRALADCVAIALATSTDARVAHLNTLTARTGLTTAKADTLPSVSADFSFPVTNDGGRGRGVSISASYTVFDNGLTAIKVHNAELGVVRQDAARTRTAQTLTFSVTKSFLTLLTAQKLEDVRLAQVKAAEVAKAMVKVLVDAGDAAPADILPLDAQLANARVQQLAAKNAVRTASTALQRAMGITPTAIFPVADVPDLEVAVPDMDAAVAKALAARPDVRQQTASVRIAQGNVQTATKNAGPRITVSTGVSLPVVGNRGDSWDISTGVAYDLFDGKRRQSAIEEARASQTIADIQREELARTVASDVQEAIFAMENARERMTAGSLSVAAAQKSYDAQEARYRQGLAIPLDLLNAQTELATAKSNAVQARYDYIQAAAQLAYAMGE